MFEPMPVKLLHYHGVSIPIQTCAGHTSSPKYLLANSIYRLSFVIKITIMSNPLIINHHGKNGRYTKAFLEQNGPGDARPTALDILKDNDQIGTIKDKVNITSAESQNHN